MSDKDKKKAKGDIDKMEGQILAKLYKIQPGAKKTVEGILDALRRDEAGAELSGAAR